MFRDVMAWAFRRVDVSPVFTAATCLVHHGVGCSDCANACPHDAIRITRTVTIDPIDCTGCGLCVATCPSHSLAPRTRAPAARDVRCSKVAGEAASVTCLARLQASDLVRLGAATDRVILAHGACDGCAVGGAAVPEAIAATIEVARPLLALHGRTPAFEVVEVERLDPSVDPRAISRRELLSAGWGRVRDAGGTVLAPLERLAPVDDEGVTDDRPALPDEHRRRWRTLELADPAPSDAVPWRLPVVADGCIFCPACTRACPTDAIRRVFDEAPPAPVGAIGGRGGPQPMRLEVEPGRCVGCDACVDVCPVHVIAMVDTATWGDLTAGARTVARSGDGGGAPGSVARGPS